MSESSASSSSNAPLLDAFYNGLFHPVREYRRISERPTNALLLEGGAFILLTSAMAPVVGALWEGGNPRALLWEVPLNTVIGALIWLAMGGILSMLAYAFTGESRLRAFLILSALSTLPWWLMGPLVLLKNGLGAVGDSVGVLAGLFIWLWSALLFCLAVGVAFRLSLERTLVVLAAPFAFAGVALCWALGFISRLSQLLF
ncbi:MAG: YIP1 family protein [Vampirovibrionales bacterium]|nr:YIP1 family protein [Vampirovibrionales bacterium]